MKTTLRILILSLLLAAASLALPVPSYFQAESAAGKVSVLFIGNSLTFINDIDKLVDGLGRAQHPPLFVRSALYPGVTLEWQLSNPETLGLINSRTWDVIVLQEQSTRSLEEQKESFRSLELLKPIVAGRAKRAIIYSISSGEWNGSQQESVDRFFACAAKKLGYQLAPVSEVRRLAASMTKGLTIYEPDNHHPGPAGAALAAEVFIAEIYDRQTIDIRQNYALPPGRVYELFKPSTRELISRAQAAELQTGLKNVKLAELANCTPG